ncbi:MAG TPA: sulfotransferase domain-containing protein, partial [Salinimicrobium sp.]|nr:sulfotransferase domain-containing protein [Salinimicrobium sp.]
NKSNGCWGTDHLYIEIGLYFEQIKRYMDVFPKRNILILNYDDFKANSNDVLKTITQFLGVAPFSIQESSHRKNVAKIPKNRLSYLMIQSNYLKKFGKVLLNDKLVKNLKNLLLTEKGIAPITPFDRLELKQFFEEDLKNTQKLTGHNLSSWLN